MLQSIHKYFKKIGNSDYILSLKSKGLFDEYIKSPATSGNSLALSLDYIGVRKRVELVGQWSTLIWSGLFYHKTSPCLKLIRIRLET